MCRECRKTSINKINYNRLILSHCTICQTAIINTNKHEHSSFCSEECRMKHKDRWGDGMTLCKFCLTPVKRNNDDKIPHRAKGRGANSRMITCEDCAYLKAGYKNLDKQKKEVIAKTYKEAERRVLKIQTESVYAFIDKLLKKC